MISGKRRENFGGELPGRAGVWNLWGRGMWEGAFGRKADRKKAPGATPWMLWVSLKLWKKFPGNGSLLSLGGCFQLLIEVVKVAVRI